MRFLSFSFLPRRSARWTWNQLKHEKKIENLIRFEQISDSQASVLKGSWDSNAFSFLLIPNGSSSDSGGCEASASFTFKNSSGISKSWVSDSLTRVEDFETSTCSDGPGSASKVGAFVGLFPSSSESSKALMILLFLGAASSASTSSSLELDDSSLSDSSSASSSSAA